MPTVCIAIRTCPGPGEPASSTCSMAMRPFSCSTSARIRDLLRRGSWWSYPRIGRSVCLLDPRRPAEQDSSVTPLHQDSFRRSKLWPGELEHPQNPAYSSNTHSNLGASGNDEEQARGARTEVDRW